MKPRKSGWQQVAADLRTYLRDAELSELPYPKRQITVDDAPFTSTFSSNRHITPVTLWSEAHQREGITYNVAGSESARRRETGYHHRNLRGIVGVETMAIKLNVNGRSMTVDVPPDTPLLMGAPGRIESARDKVWLRNRRVRRVHGSSRWPTCPFLPYSRFRRREREDHNYRGPVAGQFTSAAAGLARSGRAAMRLLPGRPDHVCCGLTRKASETDGSRRLMPP